MAHGSEDTAQDTTATGGGRGDAGPPRVATGRFAEVAARRAPRGRVTATPPDETEADRQARIARALRAAEGDEGPSADATDWRAVGMFGAGLAIGVLLGAGTALLLAPASGFETRARLLYSARRTRDRLGRGARRGSTRLARKMSRDLTRGRWAVEDAFDRRGRRRRDE